MSLREVLSIWEMLDILTLKELIRLCSLSHSFESICSDRKYWIYRAASRWGVDISDMPDPFAEYRRLHDCLLGNDVISCFKGAVDMNSRKLLKKYLEELPLNLSPIMSGGVLKQLGRFGDEDLISEFFKLYPKASPFRIIEGAAQGGHTNLVKQLIERNPGFLETAYFNAGLGGHKDLIEYLLSLEDKDLNDLLANGAATAGNLDLVRNLLERNIGDLQQLLNAALVSRSRYRNLIDYLITLGAKIP